MSRTWRDDEPRRELSSNVRWALAFFIFCGMFLYGAEEGGGNGWVLAPTAVAGVGGCVFAFRALIRREP